MRTISRLQPRPDLRLEVGFADGSTRTYDIRPLLTLEAFRELSDPAVFMTARSGGYFVEWSNGADLSADTLYLDGTVG